MGFPDPCIPLPVGASDEEVSRLCLQATARLTKWIEEQTKGGVVAPHVTRYDGTIRSACRIYQEHPRSRFHKAKRNTRAFYVSYLGLIERTVGMRLIRNVTVPDVEHYYDEWRKGEVFRQKDGSEVLGPERVDRAHDAVSMLRTVLWFCAALRYPECRVLAEELKLVKFEKGGAREEEMTFAHAKAFIGKALELGARGAIPADRARSLAIGVAAQFELLLRQKDIIGEWTPANDVPKLPKGATVLERGTEIWWGFFTWESIPGWRWRMKTSKSKYRSPADFALQNYDLLFPLLDATPHAERAGAIVKGEGGLPVRQSSYRKWFREIARLAGIPDQVWNMDSRAGGATEADESNAPLEAIRGALTHDETKTTLRYLRRGSSNKIAQVNDARRSKRAADEKAGG